MIAVYFLFFGMLFGNFALCQENPTLEEKILLIEKTTQEIVQKIQQALQEQEKAIQALQQENQNLKEELLLLKQRLQSAENEILAGSGKKNSTGPQPLEKIEPKNTETASVHKNKVIQQCALALQSLDPKIRMAAIVELHKTQSTEAALVLISALQDQDPYNVMLACKALANKKAKPAIAPLFSLLHSTNKEIRLVAYESLKKITQTAPKIDPDNEKEWKKAIEAWKKQVQDH